MATSGWGGSRRDAKVELLARQPWAVGASVDDLRWLGRAADELHRRAWAPVARAMAPGRWLYLVVEGAVVEGERVVTAGQLCHGVDADVAAGPEGATVLVVSLFDEPELHRRFPALRGAPVPSRRSLPRLVAAHLACPCRRSPVLAPSS